MRAAVLIVLIAAFGVAVFGKPLEPPLKIALEKRSGGRLVSRRLERHEPKFKIKKAKTVVSYDGTIRKSQDLNVAEIAGGITTVGMYYAYLKVGGQQVDVQLDTGSSTTAFPRFDCTDCRHGDHRYNPASSANKREIACHDSECSQSAYGACTGDSCRFSLAYADGSGASGVLMCDDIEWGGIGGIDACFGAITHDSADFERVDVDGILGMAAPSLACNPTCVTPLFDAAVKQKKVKGNIFTMCLDEEGGSLTLGAEDPSVFKDGITYIPMDHSSFYKVSLKSGGGQVMIGDKVISTTQSSAVVDSGTTLLSVPKEVFEEMKQIFTTEHCDVPDLCGSDSWFDSGLCAEFTDDTLDDILDNKLPTISIVLDGGFKIELTGRDYLLEYKFQGSMYRCLGIMYLSGMNEFILGNTVMLKYSTVYDREMSRLGIGEKGDCGTPSH